MEHDSPVDIAISDGKIKRICDAGSGTGDRVVDADEQFVSPGFFEGHLHMDKATVASGGRRPARNETPVTLDDIIRTNREFFGETSPAAIADNATAVTRRGVADGVLFFRSQTYTGGSAGLDAVEGLLEAKEAVSSIAEIQVVAFPQDGIQYEDNEMWVRDALEAGADLLGGIDPAAQNRRVQETIETWFDIAETYNTGMDVHIHEPGPLGMYSMNRLAEAAMSRAFDGDITVSHAYALAEAAEATDLEVYREGTLQQSLERFGEAGLKFVTCYPTTRSGMPVRELTEHNIPIGLGTDNVQTYTDPRQSTNLLTGALIEAYKLGSTANGHLINPALRNLWTTMTYQAAEVFGFEGYGIEEGNPADLVVFDVPGPEWAIIEQPTPRYVLKDGQIVAEDGTLTVDTPA